VAHADHRLVRLLGARERRARPAAARRDAGRIGAVGHLGSVDAEGAQRHATDRLLVGVAVLGAHHEVPRRDQHGVGLRQRPGEKR
jgi:hypothetical protein